MTHFSHYAYGEFVPYLERKGEMDKLTNVILKKCNPDEYARRIGKERNDTEENVKVTKN
jgi:hypothetical protein